MKCANPQISRGLGAELLHLSAPPLRVGASRPQSRESATRSGHEHKAGRLRLQARPPAFSFPRTATRLSLMMMLMLMRLHILYIYITQQRGCCALQQQLRGQRREQTGYLLRLASVRGARAVRGQAVRRAARRRLGTQTSHPLPLAPAPTRATRMRLAFTFYSSTHAHIRHMTRVALSPSLPPAHCSTPRAPAVARQRSSLIRV